jgi:hypothetical protein
LCFQNELAYCKIGHENEKCKVTFVQTLPAVVDLLDVVAVTVVVVVDVVAVNAVVSADAFVADHILVAFPPLSTFQRLNKRQFSIFFLSISIPPSPFKLVPVSEFFRRTFVRRRRSVGVRRTPAVFYMLFF